MCNFITATLPAGADSAAFRAAVDTAGLRFRPLENRYVQAQLLPNESYFEATRAMCDCSTELGSRNVNEPKYDRTRELRAKGWGEAKIAAWQRTQGPRPKSRDGIAQTGDLTLAQWIAFLRAALALRQVGYVGLLQHHYRTSMLQLSERARGRGEYFFYVRVHQNMGPEERGRRYEDPLDDALEAEDLGRITGGGSQLGEGDTIEYFGIDVRVLDRERGLACICRVMRECGAPKGAVVEEYLPTYVEHPVWTEQ